MESVVGMFERLALIQCGYGLLLVGIYFNLSFVVEGCFWFDALMQLISLKHG